MTKLTPNQQNMINRVAATMAIEKGMRDAKKNPYFLSKDTINKLCEEKEMNFTPLTLMWGDECEQIEFVKLIFLAILMGKENNPFLTCTVDEYIQELKCTTNDSDIKEQILDENNYKAMCDFFISNKNAKKYDILFQDTNDKNEKLHTLTEEEKNTYGQMRRAFINQLMEDFEFSDKFIDRYYTYKKNIGVWAYFTENCDDQPVQETMIRKMHENVLSDIDGVCNDILLYGEGEYGELILAGTTESYWRFMVAFTKLWRNYGTSYLEFFKQELFSDEKKIVNGLRKLSKDNFILKMLFGEEFKSSRSEIMNSVREGTDYEAMLVRMNFEAKYYYIECEKIGKEESEVFFATMDDRLHRVKDLMDILKGMNKCKI